MEVQTELVQPGWQVCAADGQEIGQVLRLEGNELLIKHHGMLGDKTWSVPRSAVSSVEEHRVELSMTSAEVKQAQSR